MTKETLWSKASEEIAEPKLNALDEKTRNDLLYGTFPEPDYICPACNHGLYIADARGRPKGETHITCKNCRTKTNVLLPMQLSSRTDR